MLKILLLMEMPLPLLFSSSDITILRDDAAARVVYARRYMLMVERARWRYEMLLRVEMLLRRSPDAHAASLWCCRQPPGDDMSYYADMPSLRYAVMIRCSLIFLRHCRYTPLRYCCQSVDAADDAAAMLASCRLMPLLLMRAYCYVMPARERRLMLLLPLMPPASYMRLRCRLMPTVLLLLVLARRLKRSEITARAC